MKVNCVFLGFIIIASVLTAIPSVYALDNDLVSGWPKVFPNYNTNVAPAIADLDGDGTKEVIMALPDSKVYAYRKDGSNFPGFPFSAFTGGFYNWQVNINDLDNDGRKEIIATALMTDGRRMIQIVKSDGTAYPNWPNPILLGAQTSDDGIPTIADLNGDGKKELVVMEVLKGYYETTAKLHAFILDGTELAGFPRSLTTLPPVGYSSGQIPPSFYGALSIADLDKDGKPEIAWGFSNRFYLFDSAGNILPGWPFITPVNYNGKSMIFENAPASGDVDGDGNLEIFAVASFQGCDSCDTKLYGWKKSGTVLSGWPKNDGIKLKYYDSRFNTPSFADIDNDGRDEIIVGLNNLTIFDLEGKKNMANMASMNTQPALSDVDGDGRLEFAGSESYSSLIVVREDGTIYWKKTLPSGTFFSTPPAVADLDKNGKMELVAVHRPLTATDTRQLVVYLWEIPTANPAKYEWPMFSHDSQRTGRLTLSANTITTADTTSPTTSITSPASDSTISGTVTVAASASDNVGVTKVEFYRNGALVATDTASPYTFTLSTTQSANGGYTLQTKAYDAANNAGASSRVSVTVSNVDSTPPVVSITSPSNGAEVLRRSTVTIKAGASDNVGVTKVEFYVNNVLQCSGTAYTCSWYVPEQQKYTYSLLAKAYDARGNVGKSAIVTVTSR